MTFCGTMVPFSCLNSKISKNEKYMRRNKIKNWSDEPVDRKLAGKIKTYHTVILIFFKLTILCWGFLAINSVAKDPPISSELLTVLSVVFSLSDIAILCVMANFSCPRCKHNFYKFNKIYSILTLIFTRRCAKCAFKV